MSGKRKVEADPKRRRSRRTPKGAHYLLGSVAHSLTVGLLPCVTRVAGEQIDHVIKNRPDYFKAFADGFG